MEVLAGFNMKHWILTSARDSLMIVLLCNVNVHVLVVIFRTFGDALRLLSLVRQIYVFIT